MDGIIDTSVFCGYWPFRNLPQRTPQALKAHLQAHGVRQAWVSATEAILFPDPMQANEPLFEAISGDPFFLPVAIIDPTLATWRRDATACLGKWGCRALKMLPNYHSYELGHTLPAAAHLVGLAQEAEVPMCVQMRMMDERSHHPLMKVPGVPAEDLVGLASRYPEARLLACGALRPQLPTLAQAPNIWAEVSMVEAGRTLWAAVEAMGPERIVFGSHSPFIYFEAVAAKLEADPVDVAPRIVDAVRESNAATLLGEA